MHSLVSKQLLCFLALGAIELPGAAPLEHPSGSSSAGDSAEREAEEQHDAMFDAHGPPVYNYNDKTIEGIPVYNYNAKSVSGDGKTTWILVNKETASEYQVHSLCVDEESPESTCMAEGSPTALGGLAFSTIEATEKELAKKVRKHKDVIEFIEPSMPVKALPIPNSTQHDESFLALMQQKGSTSVWGLDRIDDAKGLDGDYSPPGSGRGVHVYVLDTGIRTTHSDFGGRAIPTVDASSGRVRECSPSDTRCAMDRQGHGTHCAGTIGGAKYGVAKGCSLYAVKVLGDSGSGSWAGIMGAMDWVSKNGKKPAIMSMSLGGSGRSQAAVAAVDRAAKAGVTVVVAAGNENDDACGYSPAFVPQAITVGATDRNDGRARFSNYGRCLDIWGPGVNVLSAGVRSDSSSASMSGTSMACPHVAGGAALILEKNKGMSPNAVNSALKRAAVKGAISDVKSGSPNELLNVGSGGGGGPSPSPRPSPNPSPPGCPPCRCPSPNPSPSPSPSPGGGERRRRRNRGGKGGSSNDGDESRRRRRRK